MDFTEDPDHRAIREDVAASGACMNGESSIHLSIFGMHPVVRDGSAELRQRYLPRSY